jgi:hypothetical protein
MKEKTAVEWLEDKISKKDCGDLPMFVYNAIEQALEMEKEDKHSEYMRGWKDGYSKQELKSE